jgi:response regulator RpfG family c-di-GMP phosphodiesterase
MKRTILSVNGNKPFNYILKTVLSDKYAVLLAANPVSGLRLMKEYKNLDLILIDMDMFPSEAIDFILHVKTSVILDKPIIVLSSGDMNLLHSRFSKIRIQEIFKKPFNPVILLQLIDKLLMPIDITFSIRP